MAENEGDAVDAYGFGRSKIREMIKEIRPAAPPDVPRDMAVVDAAAESAGFVSREATFGSEGLGYRPLRVQRVEPRIPLNMRVPISIGEAFQRFCEENRYSYPEGLAEVMRRAGLPLR
ncbi:hypothetical protein ACPOL_7256 (plasmid) [Acidisarcina polymorpha]|uniref:Uncharacterized protein n=1 Tax=Acidisarcina polymorpha TaxID=2211140 RepID=A0A2Z5GCY9_9BACT|nr:hypothetical protein [Acidisarcina polymorpha]AXC16446.1 hypothetical protein ACPOL_7256 [Acidisarcina polymorpha]